MNTSVIWLHEEALRFSHTVVAAAPQGARIVYVWDDAYLQRAGYSLKRLVFIYETLCARPVEILRGDTLDILKTIEASTLYVPASVNPSLHAIIRSLSSQRNVVMVMDEPFVTIKNPREFKRFFHYWGQAEKTAFMHNGGHTQGSPQ